MSDHESQDDMLIRFCGTCVPAAIASALGETPDLADPLLAPLVAIVEEADAVPIPIPAVAIMALI